MRPINNVYRNYFRTIPKIVRSRNHNSSGISASSPLFRVRAQRVCFPRQAGSSLSGKRPSCCHDFCSMWKVFRLYLYIMRRHWIHAHTDEKQTQHLLSIKSLRYGSLHTIIGHTHIHTFTRTNQLSPVNVSQCTLFIYRYSILGAYVMRPSFQTLMTCS